MEADWPTKQDAPYIGLIRILPQSMLNMAVARAIETAAQTISQKEAANVIQHAANSTISKIHSSSPERVALEEDDYPKCGNDLAWLLEWLRHHPPKPDPGPDPDPWHNVATIGLIGQVITKVGGPVQENIGPALSKAIDICTQR